MTGSANDDLNSLIDPASGWELFNAYAINDGGIIVRAGVNSSFPSGQEHAFMAVPMAEPMGAGLLALCIMLRGPAAEQLNRHLLYGSVSACSILAKL